MFATDNVTEVFCLIDELDKNVNAELSKKQPLPLRLLW